MKGHKLPEEAVRCRECVHYRAPDALRDARCDGVFVFVKPDPDGFCAWGAEEGGAMNRTDRSADRSKKVDRHALLELANEMERNLKCDEDERCGEVPSVLTVRDYIRCIREALGVER